MDSIYCTFDQKLTLSDIGTLCKLTNAVIPIPSHRHLIGNTNLGLYTVLSTTTDYIQIRDILKTMVLTILQKVEGNQLILIRPKIGHQYEIKNTGPFPLEKGDQLSLLPPFLKPSQQLLVLPNWELILPLLIPTDVATEINVRMLCISLLSIHRKYEEVQIIIDELRTLQYRDVTIKLPDVINDCKSTFSMKTACISFSMIATMSPDIVQTYIERLSLEDQSMLLIKCQELLAKKNFSQEPSSFKATEIKTELQKIKTVFTMINQINSLTQEKTFFIVADVSADNRLATCIFKE